MKKFRFGLDSVLDYRRQVLDGCQGEYAQALDQVRQQEARKAETEDRYRRLNQEFRDTAAAGITAADALTYEGGLRLLEREIAQEDKLLEDAREPALRQVRVDLAVAAIIKAEDIQVTDEDVEAEYQKQHR